MDIYIRPFSLTLMTHLSLSKIHPKHPSRHLATTHHPSHHQVHTTLAANFNPSNLQNILAGI